MKSVHRTVVVGFIVLASLWGSASASAQEEAAQEIPWTAADLQEAFSVGTRFVYARSGTDTRGREAAGTHHFEVKSTSEQVVDIDSIWEDAGERGSSLQSLLWKDAIFLFSFSNAQAKVLGTEQVETPLGSFDTVVVEVSDDFFGNRQTYWMIPERPGAYAKVVDHGKEGSSTNLVMVLNEMTSASP